MQTSHTILLVYFHKREPRPPYTLYALYNAEQKTFKCITTRNKLNCVSSVKRKLVNGYRLVASNPISVDFNRSADWTNSLRSCAGRLFALNAQSMRITRSVVLRFVSPWFMVSEPTTMNERVERD